MTNREKLVKRLLTVIPLNHRLELGNDTFLTGYLDGSDKIYGWVNIDNTIYVETRDGICDMDIMEKADISYVFNSSSIYENIGKGVYECEELDEYELNNFK